MPTLDRIAAGLVLGGSAATVAVRAFAAWRRYRIQRRALALLRRSVAEVERPEPPERPERPERPQQPRRSERPERRAASG